MAPTATNTDEAYKTAPLGNNSKLSKIELSGLHNSGTANSNGNQ